MNESSSNKVNEKQILKHCNNAVKKELKACVWVHKIQIELILCCLIAGKEMQVDNTPPPEPKSRGEFVKCKHVVYLPEI